MAATSSIRRRIQSRTNDRFHSDPWRQHETRLWIHMESPENARPFDPRRLQVQSALNPRMVESRVRAIDTSREDKALVGARMARSWRRMDHGSLCVLVLRESDDPGARFDARLPCTLLQVRRSGIDGRGAMTPLVRALIAVAVSFAVWGDFHLKRYGDRRATRDLVCCLALWELCAVAWVFAYRERVPLGRTTVFGAAVAVVANTAIGIAVFGERLSPSQCVGVVAALCGMVLLG